MIRRRLLTALLRKNGLRFKTTTAELPNLGPKAPSVLQASHEDLHNFSIRQVS